MPTLNYRLLSVYVEEETKKVEQSNDKPIYLFFKLVIGIAYLDHISYNILKLDDMIKLQTALFVHRHFNNNLPINFQGYFTNVNTCHSIATRRQACGLNYHIPRCSSSKLQRSIKYKEVKIWNSTPLEMRKFNL